MVMRLFADLEKKGYEYTSNADSFGAHGHMPDKDQSLRALPATHHSKLERMITREGTPVSVVYTVVTTEAIYSPSGDVKYKVSVQKKAAPRREDDGIVDIDYDAAVTIDEVVVGYFDREFNDIKNGKNVLLSCLGREKLLY